MSRLDRAATISDLRLLAQRRLPHAVFNFIDGGAGDESCLRGNEAHLAALQLMPRVAVDVSARSARTEIAGVRAELPLVIAPTGLAGLFWPQGERLTAQIAARMGIPYCLSTNSVDSMEEVAQAVDADSAARPMTEPMTETAQRAPGGPRGQAGDPAQPIAATAQGAPAAAPTTAAPTAAANETRVTERSSTGARPHSERWFQLYFLKDEALMDRMLERARASGYRVLCLTLDLAMQGRRNRDIRNGFTVPLRPGLRMVADVLRHPAWLAGYLCHGVSFGNFAESVPPGGFTSIAQHVSSLCDASADWDTVHRVAEKWGGPVVIKGVLHPDDARHAVDLGAAAVIVSNHGGRQLGEAVSALSALPGVVAAVEGRAQVLLDGGVRTGVDVVKARALGADACMIGRAVLWGLASGGGPGVARALGILRDEIDIAQAMLGCPEFAGIGAEALAPGMPVLATRPPDSLP